MPNITSIVAVTLVFSTLFGNNGMINWILNGLGLDSMAFNSGWWGVKIAISTMVMWRWTGYNAIIFLSGLQSIPTDLYEAARIDGANRRQQLTFITLPLLKPFIVFVTLLSTIGALQLFTEPYVFLGQAGTGSTRQEGITMVTYLYSEAFRNGFLVRQQLRQSCCSWSRLFSLSSICWSQIAWVEIREGVKREYAACI